MYARCAAYDYIGTKKLWAGSLGVQKYIIYLGRYLNLIFEFKTIN